MKVLRWLDEDELSDAAKSLGRNEVIVRIGERFAVVQTGTLSLHDELETFPVTRRLGDAEELHKTMV